MERKHIIIKGALFLFAGKIGNLVLSSLQILLIPRILGPSSMGFYSYWISVYFILGRILGLGGQQIAIKYIPELRIKNKASIPSLIIKAASIKMPVFLVIIGGGLFLWAKDYHFFLITAAAALLFSLNLLGESVLYSFNRMDLYALVPIVRLASRIALVLGLFYLFHHTGIVSGIFGAPLLAFLLSVFLVLPLIPKKKTPLEKSFNHYFSFGFWIYLSVALQGLILWSIPILAELFGQSMDTVGFFGVGVQICFSAILLIFFISESTLPSLVEFQITDPHKFKDSLRFAWKYTNILLFPLVIGGYVLAQPLIRFVIGKEYLAGTVIIKLFFPAIIFLSWIRYHTHILFVFEKKTKIFFTHLINLGVFLGSWLFFIKTNQIELAALSLSLGAFLSYLFILIHSFKLEKVKKYVSYIFKPLTAASLMGVVVYFFHVHSFIQLVGVILIGGLTYGVFLFAFKGLGKYDIKIFKEFILQNKKNLKSKGQEDLF
ncbi:MAG TPA: oligosaccharide flippase family protein [Acidobacteriota bacterium]|nr:oligosaccharide flippase family protein [Acidobacteriota bacterium]